MCVDLIHHRYGMNKGPHHHEVFPPSFSRKLENQDSDRKNKRQLNLVVFCLLHQPRQHSIIGTQDMQAAGKVIYAHIHDSRTPNSSIRKTSPSLRACIAVPHLKHHSPDSAFIRALQHLHFALAASPSGSLITGCWGSDIGNYRDGQDYCFALYKKKPVCNTYLPYMEEQQQ